MTTLYLKRYFEPSLFLKKGIVLIDNCKYCDLNRSGYVSLPEGSFLLKIRIFPNFYSNTLLITEKDEGKVISIKGALSRNILHKYIYYILLLSLISYTITKSEYLILPAVFSAILSSYLHFVNYRKRENYLKIEEE